MANKTYSQRFQEYLVAVADPDNLQKLCKLEFLNDDDTVAYVLDNRYKKRYSGGHDSRAFLQDGTLNVSLQNGQRRKASITLENLDGAFDYAIGKLWFGQRVRLSMGCRLSDGYEFYLPQGIFYLDSPQNSWKPNGRKATYSLVDKWARLDGTILGKLKDSYTVNINENIFDAMLAILHRSIYTQKATNIEAEMFDSQTPLFTDIFNSRFVTVEGKAYPMCLTPEKLTVEQGGTCADMLLKLNSVVAGWIGYDASGALNVMPSENDTLDQTKPIQWEFTPYSKTFLGLTEKAQIGQVYNHVTIVGESLSEIEGTQPYGIAVNNDPSSDTSIQNIGLRSYIENDDNYHTDEQCRGLAAFRLKRMTALQKSVTIESTQLFHLQENNLVTVLRADKPHSPIERHLIQSFSLPLAENKSMTITATSVADFPAIEYEEVQRTTEN